MLNEKLPVDPSAYAWIRGLDLLDTSFVLNLPCEDTGKKEKTLLHPEPVVLKPGMLGIISGKVDNNEDPFETIKREALEEWELDVDPSWISNGLPRFSVKQQRSGLNYNLEAIGHTLKLPYEKIVQLRAKTPVIEVGDEALPRFLRENKKILRPHVYLAGQLILRRRQLS